MQVLSFPYGQVKSLAYKDVFYQNHYHDLKDFLSFPPTKEGLREAILQRQNYDVDRHLLHEIWKGQYIASATELQLFNISKITEKTTFTVTTAHQPVIFGGPAYYFYKICSTIHLANSLNADFPEFHFIPVFINGSEDHDVEEIKKTYVFHNELIWDTLQHGPVGRFSTEGLDQVFGNFSHLLGHSPTANQIITIFQKSLQGATDYNTFVFNWVNAVFGKYGLLFLNMDNAHLKRNFLSIMRAEIFETPSQALVLETQNALEQFGFKPQAYAREVNLFYLSHQSRDRIIPEENNSYVIGSQHYSAEQLSEMLTAHPEHFSPNVIMRPLYQEFSLPNIAFIGGGGEISYWLERKQQFEHFGVFYPVLIRRNSFLLVPKNIQKTIEKLHLEISDFLLPEHEIITKYLGLVSAHSTDLTEEENSIMNAFDAVAKKAGLVDATLEPFVHGEASKLIKGFSNVKHRIIKAAKSREETSINQIKNIHEKLFPAGGLQERKDNLFSFLVNQSDKDLLEEMIQMSDPMDKSFKVALLD